MKLAKEIKYIVGIDEAGRGPLAGPVSVGLVMISVKNKKILNGVKDSKKLSEQKRERWFQKFRELEKKKELFYASSMVGAGKIDELGITKCIDISIHRALAKVARKIKSSNCQILLDGSLRAPKIYRNQRTIIKGDGKIPVISAASIVAKVTRDRKMKKLSNLYPKYNFHKHKGYGTKEHFKKIAKYGACGLHRRSFLKI